MLFLLNSLYVALGLISILVVAQRPTNSLVPPSEFPTPSPTTSGSPSAAPANVTTTLLSTSTGTRGTSLFTTVISLTTAVNASTGTGSQTTTSFPSLSTYTPCVTQCLSVAVSQANCSSITDVECFCSSTKFTTSLVNCITTQCADQLKSAEALSQQFCALSSPSVSLTFPPPSSSATSPLSSAAASSSSLSAPAPTGGAAPMASSGLWGTVFGVVGVVVGALLDNDWLVALEHYTGDASSFKAPDDGLRSCYGIRVSMNFGLEGLGWPVRGNGGVAVQVGLSRSVTAPVTSNIPPPPMSSSYKGKVAHRSWQHLPPEIVRLVVTHALLDISASAFLPQSWTQREQWLPRMAFNVVRDTETMEHFMTVCPPWALALETHLFWAQAAAVLDPHDALLNLTRSPNRVSPYYHFRFNILNRSCVICRVNMPHTSHGLCAAKRSVYTLTLGHIPACREHRKEKFCGLCLRDHADEAIAVTDDSDTWPNVEATCRSCRAEWLWRACETLRERDAIGGRSFTSPDWETRAAVDAFLESGDGTIREVRALALEKHWLRRNTKIADMLSHAVAATRYQTREEGFESEEEISEDEDDMDLMSMTEDAGGVRDLAINDWARNRILDGLWYSPADQWHALQAGGPNRPEGVVPAIHPCSWNLPPEDAEAEHPSAKMANSEIPTSFALCEAAFEAFRRQMRAVLLPAMTNLVRKIVIECAADGADPCIKAARYDVEDVARELRDAGVWYNGMDWLLRRANGEREREEKARVVREREARERRGKKEDADDSSSSSKSDDSHTTSPVLSTSTLHTTPSPPPLVLKKGEEASLSPTSLSFPIAISPILESPTLIPSIPFVPVTMASLPPLTIETFKAVWREACTPLFQCRCRICERAVLKANIEAGNIVPTQRTAYAPPRPVVPVQVVRLEAALPIQEAEEEEEEELIVSPSDLASDVDMEVTTGRKRSSEDLECEEEEEEEEEDMDEFVYPMSPSPARSRTPPKRVRRNDYQGASPGYGVPLHLPATRLQKRRSEELNDIEEPVRPVTKKRARKGLEDSPSPPTSISPSDEGEFQLTYARPDGTTRVVKPKSAFAVLPGAEARPRTADDGDSDGLYVMDDMASDLDAEGETLEIASTG